MTRTPPEKNRPAADEEGTQASRAPRTEFMEVYGDHPADDSRYKTIVFDPGAGGHAMHIHGYHDAAELLLKELEAGRGGNHLFYPAAYVLRHAIELLLKENITVAKAFWKFKGLPRSTLWRTHDLGLLASELEKSVRPSGDPLGGPWKGIRRFLSEWETADPRGDSLRYAREVGGSPRPLPGMLSFKRLATEGKAALDFLFGERIQLDEVNKGNPSVALHLSPEGRELMGLPRSYTKAEFWEDESNHRSVWERAHRHPVRRFPNA